MCILGIKDSIISLDISSTPFFPMIYKNKKYASLLLKAQIVRARLSEESNRVTGWLTSILHRMGVVLMNNNHFDFKDLIAFATFIIVLLTFVFTFGR